MSPPLNVHALVIGVSQYAQIRPLPRVADAQDVAAALRDPAVCGADPANVALLVEGDATRAAILDGLDQLARRAGPDATVVIYFSGHGGQLAGGESYVMPVDGAWGTRDRLDATAIGSRVLGERLAQIRARQLTVILDCCHAAELAHARDLAAEDWLPALGDGALGGLAAGEGRVVMAASHAGGAAYVVAGARHGLFTAHLLGGLRGAAAGRDGCVRVLDLYDHVQRNVVARNPAQQPVLKTEIRDNYALAICARDGRPALSAVAPPSRFAYDVLVVYSPDPRDAAWARELIRRLEASGVRVCSEERDAELAETRMHAVEQLVETSRYTMPVLTRRFSAARFSDLQTVMAQQLGVEDGIARLIPIVREPCEARLGLRALVHLDMLRDDNIDPGIERLVRTLRKAAAPAR
jgi:hypothetical protein